MPNRDVVSVKKMCVYVLYLYLEVNHAVFTRV